METVKLGYQGLELSHQGLGCMGMSEFYGTSNEGEAIATIHRAIELGVTFLDTASLARLGVDRVQAIAEERGDTASQVRSRGALAWGRRRPDSRDEAAYALGENAAAAEVELTGEELGRLEEAFPTAGDRYPDMSHVNL